MLKVLIRQNSKISIQIYAGQREDFTDEVAKKYISKYQKQKHRKVHQLILITGENKLVKSFNHLLEKTKTDKINLTKHDSTAKTTNANPSHGIQIRLF